MNSSVRCWIALLLLSATLSSRGFAQANHVVRLIAGPGKQEFRFEPSVTTVKPNDVVTFRVVSGAPHSVVFEGQGLSAGVRGAFNSAMPRRSGDLSSPLLTASGKDYQIVVPQVPSGTYAFYCLPHRAYDMRGELKVE
jgi:plastocyanin